MTRKVNIKISRELGGIEDFFRVVLFPHEGGPGSECDYPNVEDLRASLLRLGGVDAEDLAIRGVDNLQSGQSVSIPNVELDESAILREGFQIPEISLKKGA